jgi:hypothetical protein
MGHDYSYIALTKKENSYVLEQFLCKDAEQKSPEQKIASVALKNLVIDEKYNYRTRLEKVRFYLRVSVKKDGYCTFSYSVDGRKYQETNQIFKAREGKWIGAKTGLFILNEQSGSTKSWIDIDWFRIEQ